MVVDVALYTLVHQPRRLKLPAQPVPRYASVEDIARCLFDERANEHAFRQVAQTSYYPAARMFLELVRQRGLRLALGFSLSFVRQAERWEPALLDLFRELAAEESVELVGVDPYHSLHCLLDLPAFAASMNQVAAEMERLFGKRPLVAATTEMCQSASLYNALDVAGFRGALFDGDARILQWRSSTYLYRYSDEQPNLLESRLPAHARRSARSSVRRETAPPGEPLNTEGLFLLARHRELSADVSQRFSNAAWTGYPLYAEAYARWIAQVAGDFVLLNWDFASVGEHHPSSTGIFEFIKALPTEFVRQEVALRTPGEIIARYAGERAYHLPLPVHPPAWSELLALESGADHGARRELFHLLRDIYALARLTENPDLLDLALWLAQVDHFRLHQDFGFPFTLPQDWWRLGSDGIAREQKQIYLNVLNAFEPYLPVRQARQARLIAEKPALTEDSVVTKPRTAARHKASAEQQAATDTEQPAEKPAKPEKNVKGEKSRKSALPADAGEKAKATRSKAAPPQQKAAVQVQTEPG